MSTLIKHIEPNLKQKECIENIEGTIMVLAGPGTGKTFTLVHRIEHMLKNKQIAPDSILCMTFSDTAASEMKNKIIAKLGKIATGVEINTYHSFCNNLIKQYPSKFELLDNVNIIDNISKANLMKQCLDEYKPQILTDKWNNRYHYLQALISAVDEVKKNRITKEQYVSNMKTNSDWLPKMEKLENEKLDREQNNKALKSFMDGKYEPHKKRIEKAKEAWDIVELYIQKMGQKNFIDFNDMINLVVETFKSDNDFLEKAVKGYKYLLIDEYQDTNVLQNKLIDLLAKGAKTNNIFVVGDDDQIIYGFQGARSDNLENFLKKYPDSKVICLSENNRSTQNILDLSYNVIYQDNTRLENNPDFEKFNISKKLIAKNPEIIAQNKKISLISYADKLQENNSIIETVKEIIKSGNLPKDEQGQYKLNEIAVLSRENYPLEEFAILLEANNIPHQMRTPKSIFEIKPSILLYFYLKILDNHIFAMDKLYPLLAAQPFDFDLEDYNFLLGSNKPLPRDFISLINENIDRNWKDPEKIKNFIETYDKLKTLKFHKSLRYIVLEIANRTGILGYYTNSNINTEESILAIKRLADEADSYNNLNKTASLSDFIKHLDSALNDNIEINIEKDSHIKNAIQLITLHSSKGREFEYVFMPNLTSQNWEKKRNSNKLELPIAAQAPADEDIIKKSEQLKLMFVGITRAKHFLKLSYPNIISGKTYSMTSYLSMLEDIDNIVDLKTYSNDDLDYFKELGASLKNEEFNYHFAFENELKERLKTFSLSAHSYNLYRNCPRQFLYAELYKIPIIDKDTQYLNYGNAVHKTLEQALNLAIENNRYPDKDVLIDLYNKKLATYKFSDDEKYQEYLARGKKCIENYYHHLISTPLQNIFGIEYRFDGIKFNENSVKGFIDKIEKNEDGTYSLYDYKTGSAKSKNDVAEDRPYERYYNQMRFYKLAFETKNQGCKVSKAGLIFVEEPEKNLYLEFTEEEINDLKSKIEQTFQNIHQMKFDPVDCKKTKQNNCEYCDYKMMCRLNVI